MADAVIEACTVTPDNSPANPASLSPHARGAHKSCPEIFRAMVPWIRVPPHTLIQLLVRVPAWHRGAGWSAGPQRDASGDEQEMGCPTPCRAGA